MAAPIRVRGLRLMIVSRLEQHVITHSVELHYRTAIYM